MSKTDAGFLLLFIKTSPLNAKKRKNPIKKLVKNSQIPHELFQNIG